ncbi:polyisoprenoid-binding protein YceI [Rubricella aquisinus]|uniref:Polyisoprenoid-binding protein YceI n=1 Tax=Rubricella aquisinus TaxID=2028108 RepID=A0A840X089_9RHOB|nr:YceI family protein [Rubricella aquisinus]MBB5515315.1 polyisoprenoid-binding protein YceI [Rubricella aquisinus]
MLIRSLALTTALVSAPLAAQADWTLDPSHTSIMFSVNHLGFSDTIGFFESFDGDVTFDANNIPATEVSFTIDAASINTLWEARDAHIRNADFLDVENHPAITFVSTSVEQTSDTTAIITGDMTLRGVTQEVTFDASLNQLAPNPFNPTQGVAGFTITGEVDRTAFGIDFGAPVIGAIIPVTINTELNAPAALIN